jgi:hypothetical protein
MTTYIESSSAPHFDGWLVRGAAAYCRMFSAPIREDAKFCEQPIASNVHARGFPKCISFSIS